MKQEVLNYWIDILEKRGYKILAYQKTHKNYYDENINENYYISESYEEIKNGLYKLIFLVKDKEGYIFSSDLSFLLKDNAEHFCIDTFNEKFIVNNINIFIKSKNRPYILDMNNVYTYADRFLLFHCTECDKDFYCSWARMQKYLKNKKHNCKSTYHRTDSYFSDDIYLSSSRKQSIVLFNFLPKQESFYNPQYENNEHPITSQLKKYCVENYNAILEYDECLNPKTGYFLPYDIFITKYNLYIEVQGKHHYEESQFFNNSYKYLLKQKERDLIKKNHAKQYGNFMEIDLRQTTSVEDAINQVENIIGEIN